MTTAHAHCPTPAADRCGSVESSWCAHPGPFLMKAACRLGLKWHGKGRGGGYDSTPHDYTHGQAEKRTVHRILLSDTITFGQSQSRVTVPLTIFPFQSSH
jgi:hypothetical protein